MKLTTVEQVNLMERSLAINGTSQAKLKTLLESKNKADMAKADAIAKTFNQLKQMQLAKKEEIRSCKESRGLAKALSSKLSPYDQFLAQCKKPETAKDYSWLKTVFKRGTADQAEMIAMLSESSISSMKPIDPFKAMECSAFGTAGAASAFAKRFGISRK